jgi:hypothetical protein
MVLCETAGMTAADPPPAARGRQLSRLQLLFGPADQQQPPRALPECIFAYGLAATGRRRLQPVARDKFFSVTSSSYVCDPVLRIRDVLSRIPKFFIPDPYPGSGG